jgi:hypothetical protein
MHAVRRSNEGCAAPRLAIISGTCAAINVPDANIVEPKDTMKIEIEEAEFHRLLNEREALREQVTSLQAMGTTQLTNARISAWLQAADMCKSYSSWSNPSFTDFEARLRGEAQKLAR